MSEGVQPVDLPRSAIGFVFGALDATALPGPILVQLMGVLGVAEPTGRQVLARKLREGDLERERVGRISVYRMAGAYLERWLRLRHGDTPLTWDGSFHVVLHDVPERHRRRREALQSAAARAGYGQLRPGVLIGLTEPGFAEQLAAAPDWPTQDAVVETGQLDVDLPTARRIAARVWRLADRQHDLRRAADEVDDLLREVDGGIAGGTAHGELAFRQLFRGIMLAAGPRYNVPILPAELLPDDWPSDQVQQLLVKVVDRLQPTVGEYLYGLLRQTPSADLVQGGWWPQTTGRV